MSEKVPVIIFEGSGESGLLEEKMRKYRKQLTINITEKCLASQNIETIVLVTNYEDLLEVSKQLPIEIVSTSNRLPFHFGETLAEIVHRFGFDKVICLGGASVPLITVSEIDEVAKLLINNEDIVISNNAQSADLTAFSPADILRKIELPPIDNPLSSILRDQGGLAAHYLPITPGYHFDVDTIQDLLYVSLHPQGCFVIKDMIEKDGFSIEKIKRTANKMIEPNCELLLTGRVGHWIMKIVNDRLRCRLRVISEERGMKALGRDKGGTVHSILGDFVDLKSIDGFFSYLEEYCDAAIIDTRVLFHHWKLNATQQDRFYSDLGQFEKIHDPKILKFTERAEKCEVPVILGGHSVVSGGLLVLVDAYGKKLSWK